MARVSLLCKCGWRFFASDAAPSPAIPCPSCGEPVVLPGREPESRDDTAAPDGAAGRKKLVLILGGIGY